MTTLWDEFRYSWVSKYVSNPWSPGRYTLPIEDIDVMERVMESNGAVQAFWRAYCDTRGDVEACLREPHDAFAFGATVQGANEISALTCEGMKTTTAGLVWEYEYQGWKTPEAGDKAIILDGAKQPVCIIEITEVGVRPFDAVDAAFAQQEGEGWETIEQWRALHWRYFSRRCAEMGKEPSEQMAVICQHFRVVYRRFDATD